MKLATRIACFALLSVMGTSLLSAAEPEKAKNWTAPAGKIYAQQLSDKIMKAHPELISITFHGTPPGAAKDVYTMFAGSYPDRIGNPDDPDDVDVIVKGVTTVDPRYHRFNDTVKKFVMMMPMHDSKGDLIGLLVAAYHNEANSGKTEKDFFNEGITLRDDTAKEIPSFEALFAPAK